MKFYEIEKGRITIDGIDTKQMKRSEVHDAFSMVLQDTWLFEGTIKENLIYNQKNISDEAVVAATKAVGFITLSRLCQKDTIQCWMTQSVFLLGKSNC